LGQLAIESFKLGVLVVEKPHLLPVPPLPLQFALGGLGLKLLQTVREPKLRLAEPLLLALQRVDAGLQLCDAGVGLDSLPAAVRNALVVQRLVRLYRQAQLVAEPKQQQSSLGTLARTRTDQLL
jgi:hypothetical protein